MRKLLLVLFSLFLLADSVYAAKVNLTKTGTPWVWRVEDGSSGNFMLMEDGTFMVSELQSRIISEASGLDYLLMEDGGRAVFENGNGALLESASSPGDSEMLYRALIGQGWEVTDLPATIPQAIQGTDAALAYDLLVMESGSHLLLENSNTIRLEN